jgi:DNA (cytosine-5)-methyltransferase 1
VSQTLDAVLAKGQTMPEKNRFPAVLTPYTASSFAQYAEGVGTVRASGGDLGGGSETLLAQSVPFRKSKRAQSTTDDESWVPADASNTLNNFDLVDTRTTHAVVGPMLFENRPTDSRITGPHDVSPTMTSRFGTGGGNIPLVQHTMPGSVAPTIGASGPPYSRTGNERVEAEALAITTPVPNCEVSGTLRANPGSGWRSDGTPVEPVVMTSMAVRRLTPVECERLQGFPDNWSRISWKGKPEEDCPDGPRYKACGNSMAVPVMAFIGRQIAAVDSTLSPHA